MNRIKDLIKEKGYTITSLAPKLGVTRESLSRSLSSPSYPTLEKLAEVLGVEMWELFKAKSSACDNGDLSALIECKGVFYKAASIEELECVLNRLKKEKADHP